MSPFGQAGLRSHRGDSSGGCRCIVVLGGSCYARNTSEGAQYGCRFSAYLYFDGGAVGNTLGEMEGCVEGGQAATADDNDPVTDHTHLGQEVRAQDNGMIASQFLDQIAHFCDLYWAETDGRFV